jgi:rhodanese-related sulfurtransferase
MQELSALQLELRLAQSEPGPPLLVDVREPWEFALCHIEGSLLIPMGQLAAAVADMDPQQETVVICHTGVRSRVVCNHLQRNGFINVFNLSGGVHAWAIEVDSTMATY